MFSESHHRMHRQGELIQTTFQSVFLTAGAMLVAVITLIILFFGIVLHLI